MHRAVSAAEHGASGLEFGHGHDGEFLQVDVALHRPRPLLSPVPISGSRDFGEGLSRNCQIRLPGCL